MTTTITYELSNLLLDSGPLYAEYGDDNGIAFVALNPVNGYVYATNDPSGPTDADYWHHRVERWIVEPTISGTELHAYLTHPETRRLLERVQDGHTIEWNGNNRVGCINTDATAAYNQIAAELEDVTLREVWNLDDVCQATPWYEWWGERSLDAAIQDITAMAASSDIVLIGDLEHEFLRLALETWTRDPDLLAHNHIGALREAHMISEADLLAELQRRGLEVK